MIACNIPFGALQHPDFRKGLQAVLNERATVIPQTAIDSQVNVLFADVCSRIKTRFTDCKFFSLCTDGWTGNGMSFWSVTAQALDSNFNIVLERLGCVPIFSTDPSAPALATKIQQICQYFGIDPLKVSSITTDEGASSPAIARSFTDANDIHCASQCLNTALLNAYKEVSTQNGWILTVLEVCKEITAFTKRSTSAANQLTSHQLAVGEKVLTLKQEVSTRWDSILERLRSVWQSKSSLSMMAASEGMEDMPWAHVLLYCRGRFWPMVECLIILLQLFERAIKKVSVEREITAHRKAASYYVICSQLSAAETLLASVQPFVTGNVHDQECENMKGLAIAFAGILKKHVKEQMAPIDTEKIAFALSPLHRPSDNSKLSAEMLFELKVDIERGFELIKALVLDAGIPLQIATSAELYDHGMEDFFGPSPTSTPESVIEEEIIRFRDLATPELAQGLAAWWRRNGVCFPLLKEVALRYLGFPASQVSCERDFSAMRLMCTHLRSQMGAGTAYKISVVRPVINSLAAAKARTESKIAADAQLVANRSETMKEKKRKQFENVSPAGRPNGPFDTASTAEILALEELQDNGERTSYSDFVELQPTRKKRKLLGPDLSAATHQIHPDSTRSAPSCRVEARWKDKETGRFNFSATFYNMKNRAVPDLVSVFGPEKARWISRWKAASSEPENGGFPYYTFEILSDHLGKFKSARRFLQDVFGDLHFLAGE